MLCLLVTGKHSLVKLSVDWSTWCRERVTGHSQVCPCPTDCGVAEQEPALCGKAQLNQNNTQRPLKCTDVRVRLENFHLKSPYKLIIRTITILCQCSLGARDWLCTNFHLNPIISSYQVNSTVIPILLLRKLRSRKLNDIHKATGLVSGRTGIWTWMHLSAFWVLTIKHCLLYLF